MCLCIYCIYPKLFPQDLPANVKFSWLANSSECTHGIKGKVFFNEMILFFLITSIILYYFYDIQIIS